MEQRNSNVELSWPMSFRILDKDAQKNKDDWGEKQQSSMKRKVARLWCHQSKSEGMPLNRVMVGLVQALFQLPP